ncbi:MAG: di-trans,poly-cis-decaprenylcistransferase [Euryarchaeota archaeon]|nr:di-trans,poly-cis-decaprenylcistransferase [Euryarchaeota archaeon]MBU4491597.1 di-trans,poly-cis-decaprenylcistransferase [Euryarchaeota archaeon]MCG2727450.1 polyprenyl diphosphate synthase [Candidatus Methanoperedenaceae archaeon]
MDRLSLAGILYGSYEALLTNEIREKPVPSHVAIIMDGNRRFAKKHGMAQYYGHFRGADTTEKVLDWSFDLGIKQLTVYAFSTENFGRSDEEKKQLFELMGIKFDKICSDERTHRRRMRVRILGNIGNLPLSLQSSARHTEEITKNYDGVYLNVALAYGGRQELVDAARKMARKVKTGELSLKDINEETITDNLYTEGGSLPYVDLIIRTGGDERISNFLPWQANGNECAAYFCAPFWPEFRRIDFLRAVRTYQTREHERQKNTVMRVVKLLSYYGKVEVEDVIRISRRFIAIPEDEIVKILHELAHHNVVMYSMIKW